MRPRSCLTAIAVGMILLTASACTSDRDGVAQPTVAPSATGGEASTDRLAPPITAKQLDLSAAKADPCSIVPESALAQFGVTSPGVVQQNATGPACRYRAKTIDLPALSVAIYTNTGGLEGAYQRRASFDRFETGMIRGYPTVLNLQGSPDLGQAGICHISVAVNDAELINVDFEVLKDAKYYTDPCTPTNEILSLALRGVGG